MARSDPIADASLPDMRARSRPGTAIAAIIPIIATTISSSISVNPRAPARVLRKGFMSVLPPYYADSRRSVDQIKFTGVNGRHFRQNLRRHRARRGLDGV